MTDFPISIKVKPEHGFRFPPTRDAIRAAWWPLYIEPMPGSGERICVAVAVANAQNYLVTNVPGTERLRCLYGKEADFLQFITNSMTSQLSLALEQQSVREKFYDKRGIQDAWRPSIEGFYMGEVSYGVGNSLEEITRSALMMCASLVERLSDESDESAENLTHLRLEKTVQNIVAVSFPEIAIFFSRFRRAGVQAKPIDFGFVSPSVATNFAVLNPSNLKDCVKTAKSKLWDLELLQTRYVDAEFSASLRHWELMLHVPDPNDPTISERGSILTREAVSELEEQVQDQNKVLTLSYFTAPDLIANHLIDTERKYRQL